MGNISSTQFDSNRNIQTINLVKHPSTAPLSTFHGRMVKVFSPLTAKGQLSEIAKRVALVAVSPFAYFLLGVVALLGYPYTIRTTKQIPINESNTASPGDNRSSSIIQRTSQEILERVGTVLTQHNVSKIKCLIDCAISGQKKLFEIDILPKDNSIESPLFQESIKKPLQEMQNWISEKLSLKDCQGEITISGRAFCLVQDTLHVASWTTADSATRFQVSGTYTEVPTEHFNEYMKRCFSRMVLPPPQKIDSPADLFKTKLIVD
jgi:hypothetical protein